MKWVNSVSIFAISALFYLETLAVESSASYFKKPEERPLLLAHQGSMGLYPGNSQPAFEDAFESGADFIETDVRISKDGHLVLFHDTTLSRQTNIADIPEFAQKQHLLSNDWYLNDLTLAELKTLRLRQPFSFRDQSYNDQH